VSDHLCWSGRTRGEHDPTAIPHKQIEAREGPNSSTIAADRITPENPRTPAAKQLAPKQSTCLIQQQHQRQILAIKISQAASLGHTSIPCSSVPCPSRPPGVTADTSVAIKVSTMPITPAQRTNCWKAGVVEESSPGYAPGAGRQMPPGSGEAAQDLWI